MTRAVRVAVRGWITPDYANTQRRYLTEESADEPVGPSGFTLVFDTETTTDDSQRIRFGTFQLRHGDILKDAGAFYSPDEVTDDEEALLAEICRAEGWWLGTVRRWADKVFFPYAVDARGTVIAHNLPFDLSRIASGHDVTKSRKRKFRGGFSYILSDDPERPRVLVKRASPSATFVEFTEPPGLNAQRRAAQKRNEPVPPVFRGFFIDTASLAAALLSRRLPLKDLAETLGTPTRKMEADLGGPVTKELVAYAMTDVQVTWECFQKLQQRYDTFRLDTPIHRIVSEASVGKAHLRQMGITPWRKQQPDFPNSIIASVMETYYGGRTETRIRRLPVPGVYVDFLSEYPTVYALQRLWRFQIASHIDWHEEDPATVTRMLDGLTLSQVLDPGFWPTLTAIALVRPDGDLLPTRGDFKPGSSLWHVTRAFRHDGAAQWWTLADLVDSKLSTGQTPTIVKVIRFAPGPPQPGLRPITVGGHDIDPYRDDFVQRLIEVRADAKQQLRSARELGDVQQAALWDAIQHASKITANSIGYGIGIELNTTDHNSPVNVTVHRTEGPDLAASNRRSETPGQWFNPIIGTLAAAGGRLLLSTLIHQVHQAGGEYAFCDTDSLFIAATPDGEPIQADDPMGMTHPIPALAWRQVEDIVNAYAPLNPYRGIEGSILKIEDINFDPQTGQQRQIVAYSIASKRYAIATQQPEGSYRLAQDAAGGKQRSEHGLGHLMSPAEEWEDEMWEWTINTDTGRDWPEPDWFDQPALGRLTVNTAHDWHLLRHINQGRDYQNQIRPSGFLTIAHPHPVEESGLLVAPYTTTPSAAISRGDWFDRSNPKRTGLSIRTKHPNHHIDGSVAVLTYRRYITQYRNHAEVTALGPGDQPCRPATFGILQPVHLDNAHIVTIGKETNPLDDADLVLHSADTGTIYAGRRCNGCGQHLTGRQRIWCSDSCRMKEVRARRKVA